MKLHLQGPSATPRDALVAGHAAEGSQKFSLENPPRPSRRCWLVLTAQGHMDGVAVVCPFAGDVTALSRFVRNNHVAQTSIRQPLRDTMKPARPLGRGVCHRVQWMVAHRTRGHGSQD